MDCGPPGSSVHGTFQTRALEWVVIALSDNKVMLKILQARLQQLQHTGSVVVAHRPSMQSQQVQCMRLVAQQHVESFQTRD